MVSRGQLEQCMDVLRCVGHRGKKTWIMYCANVSHGKVNLLLKELLDDGFIEQVDGEYRRTRTGAILHKSCMTVRIALTSGLTERMIKAEIQ